jgi:hypothetical protein
MNLTDFQRGPPWLYRSMALSGTSEMIAIKSAEIGILAEILPKINFGWGPLMFSN